MSAKKKSTVADEVKPETPKFKIKKVLTLPQLKMTLDMPYYLKIESPIFQAKVNEEMNEKLKAEGKEDKIKLIPDGAAGAMMCQSLTILRKE